MISIESREKFCRDNIRTTLCLEIESKAFEISRIATHNLFFLRQQSDRTDLKIKEFSKVPSVSLKARCETLVLHWAEKRQFKILENKRSKHDETVMGL